MPEEKPGRKHLLPKAQEDRQLFLLFFSVGVGNESC